MNYNENKPNFKQSLISQPFTAWNLAPSIPLRHHGYGWSDYGVMANWSYLIEDAGLLDVKLSLIQGLQGEGTVLDSNTVTLNTQIPTLMPNGMPVLMNPTVRPRDGLIQNVNFSLGDNNGSLAKVVKVSFLMLSIPLDFGVSVYDGKWDDNAIFGLTMYGFHANYTQDSFGLIGECVNAHVEQAAMVNPVTAMGPDMINMLVGDSYVMKAWFVEANYIGSAQGSVGSLKHDAFVIVTGPTNKDFDKIKAALGL